MRRSLMLALTLLVSLALAATGLSVTSASGAPPSAAKRDAAPRPPSWLKVVDGVTQPQFALADAVTETLWVQTTVDSDLDGRRDRVRVQVSRPRETETKDYKVPVVFEHSPYRYNTGGGVNHDVDYEVMPQEGVQPDGRRSLVRPRPVSKPDLPGSLDDYWVPRGYAVVLGESVGTGFSDGCPTVGDSKETLGTRARITVR